MDDYRIDAVGQKVRVGDMVAYSRVRYGNTGVYFSKGEVLRLLPKSVEIKQTYGKQVKQLSHVVKLYGNLAVLDGE